MIICFELQRITNLRRKFFALPGATKYGIFILNFRLRPIKTTITIHRAVVVAFACFRRRNTFVGVICDICREISTSNTEKYKAHMITERCVYIYYLPVCVPRLMYITCLHKKDEFFHDDSP